ncbi:sulfotransferase family protein [Lusitaniella coriacea]|uniref:sulfotransferase family protein n=1 Tax=Lusitaniella coriacea TaxID=1983105 RepID=UPI003CEF892C
MNEKIKKIILSNISPPFHPVFILSAPRSGSSYFYEILRRMQNIWSFEKENDPLWFQFFPYQRLEIPSDYIDESECTRKLIDSFKSQLLLKNIQTRRNTRKQDFLDHFLQRKPILYLEKTIANCFHLDALEKIFPNALYIYMVRDGRACISSMLEGWNSGFFWKRPLPFPKNSTVSHWTYPIPPGWQNVVRQTLPEICAWSWMEHNRYVLERLQGNEMFHSRCMAISYEYLLAEPQHILEKVADFSNLTITPECIQYIENKNTSWTTLSAPKADKWKEKNPEAIEQILPQITPMLEQLESLVS